MKSNRQSIVGILLMSLSLNTFALDDSLRCRGAIVQVGDSKFNVIRKCGEPVAKDSYCKPMEQPKTHNPQQHNAQNCETVETWTYSQGAGQFSVTLEIQQGAVSSIKNGDRG